MTFSWSQIGWIALVIVCIIIIVMSILFFGPPKFYKKYIQKKTDSDSNTTSVSTALNKKTGTNDSNITTNSIVADGDSTSSNSVSSTNNSPSVPNGSLISTEKKISSDQGFFLNLNSNHVNDYIIANTLSTSTSGTTDQIWQCIASGASNSGMYSFVNKFANLAITVNGGSGSIIASTYIPNSPTQLWTLIPAQSSSPKPIASVSGSSKYFYIVPADPIYEPPNEPKQLVLSVNTANTSQYSADDIANVLKGQIIASSDQAALDQASGNATVTLNGSPLTLVAIDSTYASIWTFGNVQ